MNQIDTIIQSASQLPPFPAVLQRVLQLIDDPKSSAQDLVEVIQYDQSITANVLMVCNSAYFGLRRSVFSVREALVRIGFNQLLEIVLSYGSAHLFSRAYRGYDLAAGDLWRHSVACALLSQIISGRLHREKTAIQFTAALLHDIGKIVLNEFVADHLQGIRKLVQEKELSFLAAEKEVLGIDHAELGGVISEKWKFPKTIVAGIRYHHSPSLTPEDREMVCLISLCDLIAMMTGFGGGADGLAYNADKEIMKQYRLSAKDIGGIMAELEERLKQVEQLLNLQ
ncbi:MAG: HDOD domain-containing protein [Deltaproteobacteria bacterium]|nr:HDOD domain-containing protein [Deltaproteobacteria bacterium]